MQAAAEEVVLKITSLRDGAVASCSVSSLPKSVTYYYDYDIYYAVWLAFIFGGLLWWCAGGRGSNRVTQRERCWLDAQPHEARTRATSERTDFFLVTKYVPYSKKYSCWLLTMKLSAKTLELAEICASNSRIKTAATNVMKSRYYYNGTRTCIQQSNKRR